MAYLHTVRHTHSTLFMHVRSILLKNISQFIIFVLCFNVANRGQNDWNELLREYEVLQFVNSTSHPNIIKLIGGCTQTGIEN
jgi:hypothetical protein